MFHFSILFELFVIFSVGIWKMEWPNSLNTYTHKIVLFSELKLARKWWKINKFSIHFHTNYYFLSFSTILSLPKILHFKCIFYWINEYYTYRKPVFIKSSIDTKYQDMKTRIGEKKKIHSTKLKCQIRKRKLWKHENNRCIIYIVCLFVCVCVCVICMVSFTVCYICNMYTVIQFNLWCIIIIIVRWWQCIVFSTFYKIDLCICECWCFCTSYWILYWSC